MPKIQLEDGRIIEFDKTPTPEDIDFVASQGKSSEDEIFTRASIASTPVSQAPEKTLVQSIAEPITGAGIEVLRGVYQGAGGLATKVDSLNDLIRNKSGINITDSFGQMGFNLNEAAKELPETNTPGAWIYNLAGQIPSIGVEYMGAATPAGLISRAAVMGALNEYAKDNKDGSLVKGAVEGGVTMGLTAGAFALAGKGLTSAADALEKYGPSASKAILKQILPKETTPEQIEQTFKNLENYVAQNKSKSIKNPAEVAKENETLLAARKKEADDLVFDKTQAINTEYKLKNIDSNNALYNLKQQASKSEAELKAVGDESIQQSTIKMTEALANNNRALNEEATSIFSSVIKKSDINDEAFGKEVAQAIQEIAVTNPGVGVPLKSAVLPRLKDSIRAVIKENPAALKVEMKDGNEIVRAVRPEFQELADKITKEVVGLRKEFGKSNLVSLDALQAGKVIYQGLAKQSANSASGNPTINNISTKLYQTMSEAFNPVNFAKEATGAKDALMKLAEANKKFSDNRNIYSALKSDLFGYAPDGVTAVPNVEKIFAAFKRGNVKDSEAIKRITQAESKLPFSDRIMPKLRDLYNKNEKANAIERSYLENLKKTIIKSKNDLQKSNDEAVRRLQLQGRKLSVEEYNQVSNTIKTIRDAKNAELTALKDTLEARLQEAKTKEALFALRPPSQDSAVRLLQNFAAFGALGQLVAGNPLAAAGKAAVGYAVSPRVLTKVAAGLKNKAISTPIREAGKAILSTKDIQKLIGGRKN